MRETKDDNHSTRHVVVFSELTGEMQEKYIEMLLKHKVQAEYDEAQDKYIAHCRIELLKPKAPSSSDGSTKVKKSPIVKSSSSSSLPTQYPDLLPPHLLTIPSKSSVRTIKWLVKMINDIYDAYQDKEDDDDDDDDLNNRTFGKFIKTYFKSRYGLSSIVQTVSWDLARTIESFRSTEAEVQMFANFLDRTFTLQDLSFFIYARSILLQKINSTSLDLPTVHKVGAAVFGSSSADTMVKDFTEKMFYDSRRWESREEIPASEFLQVALETYKQE